MMNNNGVITNYTYDRNNKLISDTNNSYTYDNNGNLLSKITGETVASYTYDPMNKLKSVTIDDGLTASYVYDAVGRRLSKTVNGTTTNHIWDGDYIVREKDSTGTEISRYYRAGNKIVANKSNNATNYYYSDPHGNVVSVGNNENIYTYDAFGNQTKTSDISNPFRYCGEYFDDETGFVYLRARYYNPSTGRFITEDPAKDGLNWYVYFANNPVMFVDPSGLRSREAADKIIKDNATYIISAAEEFGVNPGILAATIYAEQRLNVDWKDDYIDGIVGFYGVDTSIGIGQLRISTAKFIEKEGYMPTLSAKDGGWNIPLIGFVHGTEQMVREKSLENSELNIKYAAGYLKYFQDEWKNVYPDIDGKTDILATLYNLGHEQTSPNSNPKPNDFGKFAKENYFYVRKLLGLE